MWYWDGTQDPMYAMPAIYKPSYVFFLCCHLSPGVKLPQLPLSLPSCLMLQNKKVLKVGG